MLDLIDEEEDLSLVSNVLHDALNRSLADNEKELVLEVDSKAARAGLPEGKSLYDWTIGGS